MPIKLLPAMLANQIAAGEVVERPASVVKELIENSLDAGATEIEISIEKGGHKRIGIRDNGGGIAKQELELALSRHATSKIESLDDLEHIGSLGFRGEALASISSVSRLTLTSKPAEQSNAWQAHTEGRDMQVTLSPAAHPDGTSIDVQDLFFNTPARRKFLRTDKTEFSHIDEVIKRIALSRFDVKFVLKHNGKTVRKFNKISQPEQQLKRLAAIFGNAFVEQIVTVKSDYQQVHLSGWLNPVSEQPSSNPTQYFYINHRVIRDKLVNHAIRQACNECLGDDSLPEFVLYLTLDPEQLDINVHPAKHEVRFHQSRLIHDFIYRAMRDVLQQMAETATPGHYVSPTSTEPNHGYIRHLQPSYQADKPASIPAGNMRNRESVSTTATENYQQLLKTSHSRQAPIQWMQVEQHYLLVSLEQTYLVNLLTLQRYKFEHSIAAGDIVSQPLLMPISIADHASDSTGNEDLQQQLASVGIQISCLPGKIMLKQVPAGLRELDWSGLLAELIATQLIDQPSLLQHLMPLLDKYSKVFNYAQAQSLWTWSQQHFADGWLQQLENWGTPLPLQQWIAQHE